MIIVFYIHSIYGNRGGFRGAGPTLLYILILRGEHAPKKRYFLVKLFLNAFLACFLNILPAVQHVTYDL